MNAKMRVQTECLSFKKCWTISSSYDFHAHQVHFHRRYVFQSVLKSFEVLPGLLLVLPGAPRLVVGALRPVIGPPRIIAGVSRCSETCCWCFQMLPLFSPDLFSPHRFFTSALRYTRRPLHRSRTLCDLTTLESLSDNFQTLPDSPTNKNIFCRWTLDTNWNPFRYWETSIGCFSIFVKLWKATH